MILGMPRRDVGGRRVVRAQGGTPNFEGRGGRILGRPGDSAGDGKEMPENEMESTGIGQVASRRDKKFDVGVYRGWS